MSEPGSGPASKLGLELGRLLRLSLSVSALADVAAGIVVARGAWPSTEPGPLGLFAGSLCVYHGGMVLNDWADRHVDAETRPERPLPAGKVQPAVALALAAGLLVAGPLLAWTSSAVSALLLGLAALLAAGYDLVGRGPWSGPFLLAACRGLNLSAGIAFGLGATRLAELGGIRLAPALLYGAYVLVVSRLGRMEDAADPRPLGRRPARHLAVLGALLLVVPLLPVPLVAAPASEAGGLLGWASDNRIVCSTLVVGLGALGLLRGAFRVGAWTRPLVLRSMGMALRRLLIFSSGLAILAGTPTGWTVGVAILLGYPLSFGLRRVFPPS